MTVRASKMSTKADTKRVSGDRQRVVAADFGARLRLAQEARGLTNADLARITDISRQLISEYANGVKVAGADNLFSLADALGVHARWLLRSEGDMSPPTPVETAADLVTLPRYDVFAFNEYGKGPPIETMQFPAAWLLAATKTTSGLWLTEMPSDALPDVAREGETIVCRDPENPLQEKRVYIFILDGSPIVRRIAFQPNEVVLRGEDEADTIRLRRDELADRLVPAGRILATVRLDQV